VPLGKTKRINDVETFKGSGKPRGLKKGGRGLNIIDLMSVGGRVCWWVRFQRQEAFIGVLSCAECGRRTPRIVRWKGTGKGP